MASPLGPNAGPFLPTARDSLAGILNVLQGYFSKPEELDDDDISPNCFVDLGCGDCRVVFEVARKFGCESGFRSVGVEYDREVLENGIRTSLQARSFTVLG